MNIELSKLTKTVDVKVPTEQGEVVITICPELGWYDYLESLKITNDDDRGVFIFEKMLRAWNLDGPDGKPLPLTAENIKRLPAKIASEVVKFINNLTDQEQEKKTP